MATLGTVDERLDAYNKNLVIDDIGDISLEMIEAEGFALDTPYVKLTGGSSLKKWDVTNVTEDGQLVYRLPQTKKDYRLIKEYYFIDPKGNRDNQELISTFS
jgi:hypothetical protein